MGWSRVIWFLSPLISPRSFLIEWNFVDQIDRVVSLNMNPTLFYWIIRNLWLLRLTMKDWSSHRFETVQLFNNNIALSWQIRSELSLRFASQILLFLFLTVSSTTSVIWWRKLIWGLALTERSAQRSFAQLTIYYLMNYVFETRIEVAFAIATYLNRCWFACSFSKSPSEGIAFILRVTTFLFYRLFF